MPQPVDMPTEIARVTAAERIQQSTVRSSLVAQQRLANEAEQERVNAETYVQQTDPKSEDVDRELRRRNPYMGRRRRREADKESGDDQGTEREDAAHRFYTADEQEQTVEDPADHRLDVTI